jgi:hypothetical protein
MAITRKTKGWENNMGKNVRRGEGYERYKKKQQKGRKDSARQL